MNRGTSFVLMVIVVTTGSLIAFFLEQMPEVGLKSVVYYEVEFIFAMLMALLGGFVYSHYLVSKKKVYKLAFISFLFLAILNSLVLKVLSQFSADQPIVKVIPFITSFFLIVLLITLRWMQQKPEREEGKSSSQYFIIILFISLMITYITVQVSLLTQLNIHHWSMVLLYAFGYYYYRESSDFLNKSIRISLLISLFAMSFYIFPNKNIYYGEWVQLFSDLARIIAFIFLLVAFLKDYVLQMKMNRDRLLVEMVIDHIQEGVVMYDREGRVQYTNQSNASFFGKSKINCIGKKAYDAFPELLLIPEFIRDGASPIYRSLLKGVEIDRVYSFTNPVDQREYELEITTRLIKDNNNEIIGCVGVWRDLTEKRKMEREALKIERLGIMSKLAGVMAHEIRNPLTSIRGFIQMVGQGKLELNQRISQILLDDIDRVNRIIHDYLSMTKESPNRGKKSSIHEIIKQVHFLYEAQVIYRGIDLQLSLQSIWNPLVPEDTIKQVIMNLFQNAMEAVDKNHGIIRVSTWDEDKWCYVQLSDNGVGISEEHLGKIGQPYFTTKEEGTGLGLTTSMQIIRDLGGKIKVDSKLGEGTAITISFPCNHYSYERDENDKHEEYKQQETIAS